MSLTIGMIMVNILAAILPYLGIQIGTEELTTTVQTLILVVTGVGAWYGRFRVGDVNAFGGRK